MSYTTIIPINFPCSPEIVFQALINLGDYPLWNTGMIKISHTSTMVEGMEYITESVIAGGVVNRSEVTVVELIKNEKVHLKSRAGAITYDAVLSIAPAPDGGTAVTCDMHFTFNTFVLNLTKSAIEAMATARVRGNLESLRALICPPRPTGA